MKKGIIINFPQTNKDGPGAEIEFKEVSDELWNDFFNITEEDLK